MAIQDIENAKVLKKWMRIVGREGYGDKVLEIAKKIVEYGEKGEYVLLARESGKIRALTTGANEDGYFSEKVFMGFHDMLWECKDFIRKKGVEVK